MTPSFLGLTCTHKQNGYDAYTRSQQPRQIDLAPATSACPTCPPIRSVLSPGDGTVPWGMNQRSWQFGYIGSLCPERPSVYHRHRHPLGLWLCRSCRQGINHHQYLGVDRMPDPTQDGHPTRKPTLQKMMGESTPLTTVSTRIVLHHPEAAGLKELWNGLL